MKDATEEEKAAAIVKSNLQTVVKDWTYVSSFFDGEQIKEEHISSSKAYLLEHAGSCRDSYLC